MTDVPVIQLFAVYALSFWHYYAYFLAYYFGAVPLPVFKRDAIALKTVALVTLAWVYFATPLDAASLVVVAAGFALNGVAAAALGPDRTYYGREVAGLPWRRVTAFPYSVIAHPMLVGNIVAFGGLLINAEFRQQWWPLACAHVALNVGLWVMETKVKPQRRGARGIAGGTAPPRSRLRALRAGCGMACVGAALGWAAGAWGSRGGEALLAGLGACAVTFAYVLYCRYSSPTGTDARRGSLAENSP